MREIKFRAWDREEKRMTDANFSISRHGKIWWLNSDGALCGAFENPSYAPHYPLQSGFVLMQFTGLKDKNGKEIYEGDILAINNISNIKYEVRFGNYEPYGSNERQQGFYLYDDSDNSTIPLTENYKIVGNIYENPELLGGGK